MLIEPRCYTRGCRNFQGHERLDGTDDTLTHICAAFPKGIPHEVAYGEDLHLEQRPDQVGLYVFDPSV